MEEFQMGKVNSLHYDECYLELSTGAMADMTSDTIQDGIDAFDNLLSMIVMENFEKILKASKESPEDDRTVELIEKEVRHLVDNELAGNHEGALHWILLICALDRLDFIITEVRKRQNKE